jgi:hypothetical protein
MRGAPSKGRDLPSQSDTPCLALQKAASVASLVLTNECLVLEAPKGDAPMDGGMPDMGGMGSMGMSLPSLSTRT